MNYASIKYTDIANGPGVRVSLFVSGCTHHCEGCFNPEAWDFNYGRPFTDREETRILAALSPSYIKGLSLLGGEPFEPDNQRGLLPFLRRVRASLPNKSVWCYSGCTLEELMGIRCTYTEEMLRMLDVLVDGEFVQAQKDPSLRFRGSANQRILDVPKSIAAGKAVIWQERNNVTK